MSGQLQLTGVFTTFSFVERELTEFIPCCPTTKEWVCW